ncbi:MAG: histidine utilization protein HutD [Candidatus Eremiobacteraeota bacterium]|jgi:environmental stress-induced protein Ves|nr:histidine utilization protein HutD [Candidatus Eremiobacteraeota bacterium]
MILRRGEYRAVPWLNGGGITHDILVDGAPIAQRRLSLATIDRDGPFSDLCGYDRTIVLAAGAGFTLAFADGTQVTLDRLGARWDFAGETMPDCSLLAGSVQAFNVMAHRDAARAEVEVAHRLPHVPWREHGPVYVFVIAGEVAAGAETLEEHDTLFIDAEERELVATQASLVVRVAFTAVE